MTAPANASLANTRIGGREYPARSSPRCGTCSHPQRRHIEERLVRGDNPAAIAADLDPDQPLTSRQILDHLRSHLPVADEAVARFREQEADRRGQLVAEGAERVVTALSFARRVISGVDLRLELGDVQPSVADALRAAVLLAPFEEQAATGYTEGDTYEGFLAYVRAIDATCTQEQVRKIGEIIRNDPVMREQWARYEAQQ